jgi:hypothetical protein
MNEFDAYARPDEMRNRRAPVARANLLWGIGASPRHLTHGSDSADVWDGTPLAPGHDTSRPSANRTRGRRACDGRRLAAARSLSGGRATGGTLSRVCDRNALT